jgi:hypothetical protein
MRDFTIITEARRKLNNYFMCRLTFIKYENKKSNVPNFNKAWKSVINNRVEGGRGERGEGRCGREN